ncbi:MAG: hypothetical protein QNJ33_14430 [Crocosphaera sp.]|nr:hypothetical protein [Crocosphaera sp.]
MKKAGGSEAGQYCSVKENCLLRQAGGAGDAGDAGDAGGENGTSSSASEAPSTSSASLGIKK